MSQKITARDEHDPSKVTDHSTITATDYTQSDGKVKRGLDISPIDTVQAQLDEEYRLRVINNLNSINQNLITLIKLMEAGVSE